MTTLAVNRPMVSLLPHTIFILVTINASGGANILDGQACPLLCILLSIPGVKAILGQKCWDRYYSEPNKDK